MFMEILPLADRQNIMQLLLAIAHVDGEVTEDELRFISHLGAINGVDVDFEVQADVQSICAKITDPQSKVIALQEVVKTALADGSYDEAEQKGVRIIAAQMEVDEAILIEIEQWVAAGQAWIAQGQAMVASAN